MKKLLLLFSVSLIAYNSQSQVIYELEEPKTVSATHVKVVVSGDIGDNAIAVSYSYCDSLGNPIYLDFGGGSATISSDELAGFYKKDQVKSSINDALKPLGISVKKRVKINRNKK